MKALRSPVDMESLREYSNMLEGGRIHGISYFGRLTLAVCKGIRPSEVESPAGNDYQAELIS